MRDYLREKFVDIFYDYNILKDKEQIQKEVDFILKQYSEPHRKYHTIDHICKCLDLLDKVMPRKNAAFKKHMVFALTYHDIIYNVNKETIKTNPFINEELSCNIFKCASKNNNWNLNQMDIDIIGNMILATTHSSKYLCDIVCESYSAKYPLRRICEFVCDIDLHQLGCGLYEFLINESLIREEYKHIPDDIFYRERTKILQSFYDKSLFLYNYEVFHKQFTCNAKRNLKHIIDKQT